MLEISSRRYLSIRSERTSVLPDLNRSSMGRQSLGSCHPVGGVREQQGGIVIYAQVLIPSGLAITVSLRRRKGKGRLKNKY